MNDLLDFLWYVMRRVYGLLLCLWMLPELLYLWLLLKWNTTYLSWKVGGRDEFNRQMREYLKEHPQAVDAILEELQNTKGGKEQ